MKGSGLRVAGQAVDPICGMQVNPEKALSSTKDGVTYYFCSQQCKTAFEAPTSRNPPPAAPQYTCPMHPEVIRDKPGACPICGMALEPRTTTLTDRPNEALIDMQPRILVSP